MATLKGNLEIVKAQSKWIKDFGPTHQTQASQVLDQQIVNVNLMIEAAKNDSLNPTLTPPPPTP